MGISLAQCRVSSVTVFGLLLALFLLLITRNVSSEPYVYDEADYMYAASLGFAANWSDTPSIPICRFRAGRTARAGRQALSERIRSGNDVLFYRHFHGPLFHYLLISAVATGPERARGPHGAMLAIPGASLAVIYFGCSIVAGRASVPVQLFGDRSTELAPHQLFAFCSLGESDSSSESRRERPSTLLVWMRRAGWHWHSARSK